MSKGSKRRPGTNYSSNYKGSNVKGGSWVQCPETGKLIPKNELTRAVSDAPVVHGDIVNFVSPITKELITDRGQLRRHNKKYGVTNSADYSDEYIAKRAKARDDELTGNTHQAKLERRQMLSEALTKQGIR